MVNGMADEAFPTGGANARWVALMHPVRAAVWDRLVHGGGATSSTLASQLEMSTGLTSYHLRYLAKLDLVREDLNRGTRRERWWVAEPVVLQMDASAPDGTIKERAALTSHIAMAEMQRHLAYWSRAWRSDDPVEVAWRAASTSDQLVVELSLEQMRQLDDEIAQLVQKWQAAPAPKQGHGRRVQLTLRTYPLPDGELHA